MPLEQAPQKKQGLNEHARALRLTTSELNAYAGMALVEKESGRRPNDMSDHEILKRLQKGRIDVLEALAWLENSILDRITTQDSTELIDKTNIAEIETVAQGPPTTTPDNISV